MKPLLAIASIALALTACSSQTVWHKEGAEEEDLRLAQRTCSREAQGYGFAFEGVLLLLERRLLHWRGKQ